MYVCGPTVYNYIHIGNARTFLNFDMMRRYLEYSGLRGDFRPEHHRRRRQDNQPRQRGGRPAPTRSRPGTASRSRRTWRRWRQAARHRPAGHRAHRRHDRGHRGARRRRATPTSRTATSTSRSRASTATESSPGATWRSSRSPCECQRGAGPQATTPGDFALWKAAKPGEPSWDSPWGQGARAGTSSAPPCR